MAGMNASGVGIAINNLYSTDATLGIVWPAMVRRALHRTNASDARDVVMNSPIGSGHHYFVADSRDAYSIETSGTRRKIIWVTHPGRQAGVPHPDPLPHLHHPARNQAPRPRPTPHPRTHRPGRSGPDSGTAENPHGAATCGAIAMNLTTGELWAQQGFIHNVVPEKWQL